MLSDRSVCLFEKTTELESSLVIGMGSVHRSEEKEDRE